VGVNGVAVDVTGEESEEVVDRAAAPPATDAMASSR
jgi:hypothetical protein